MNDQEWPPAIGPDVAQEGEVRGPVRRPGRRLLGRGPSITRKEGREPVFSRGPNSQHEQYFLCFFVLIISEAYFDDFCIVLMNFI
jgi:hypothetical protein